MPNSAEAVRDASRPPLNHPLLLGVIYLAVVAASCAALRRWLPFPEVPLVRDKMEYLARHGDEYDVLFLGSSRVNCQIAPSIFDRVAGENGVPVKSFNAGINGMLSPEDGYVLEEILRRPHRRVRWIFVEPTLLQTGVVGEDMGRSGYWHDTPRMVFLVRRLRGKALEALAGNPEATFWDRCDIWSKTVGLVWKHARYWVTRAMTLGRGAEALDRWLDEAGRQYVPAKTLGERRDGWLPMDRGSKPMSGEMLEKYNKQYADRLVQPAARETGDPVSQSALERILATVSESGATPVLFVAPTTEDRNFYPPAARERGVTILDFSDVREYPVLFAPENRLDLEHLNTAGTKIFSEILARRFVELVRPRGPTP